MNGKAHESLLPEIVVTVNGKKARALVDTGCMTTLVRASVAEFWEGTSNVRVVDGREVRCCGETVAKIVVRNILLQVQVIGLEKLITGIDVILSLDVIDWLGGATIAKGQVMFGRQDAARVVRVSSKDTVQPTKPGPIQIEDKDFRTHFDGNKWLVEWRWTAGLAVLTNQVGCYEGTLREEVRPKFEKKVERWIDERILIPWSGKVEGVLLPMAVVQPTKNKVRLVLDFRELNKYMACHTKDRIDICEEVMREWRRMERATKIMDLKSAYLQIHMDEKLWRYQLVKYKGQVYCLTRLGFGLNSTPKIMTAVRKNVLAKDKVVKRATCSYIDDILVDEIEVTVERVRDHVNSYGLTTQRTEALEDGMALGLKLQWNKEGKLVFGRGSEIPKVQGSLTKRERFSVCGKLVGHYPIVGWLRVACSFIKRQTNGGWWEDEIDHEVLCMIQEVLKGDPVKEEWHIVRSKEGVIWCDTSSLALGAILEIGGAMAEDAAWLRKKNDNAYINVAELDAMMKGVNLALKWGLQAVEIRTDSATVASWIKSEV